MAYKGIDVSKWQGVIDWQAVKASGVQFAILKVGGSDAGFYKDPMFEKNYIGAKSIDMPIGAYYFVGAGCISYTDGVADAKRFIQIISGKTFEYPVYIDIESTSPNDKAGATQACIGFVETMESAGYYCGIYASDIYGFKERLNMAQLEHIDKWVARYSANPTYAINHGMWQYSDKGRVNGISGNVDLDEAYKDYPTIIKKAGLNGFVATEQPTTPPSKDIETEYKKLMNKIERIKSIIDE